MEKIGLGIASLVVTVGPWVACSTSNGVSPGSASDAGAATLSASSDTGRGASNGSLGATSGSGASGSRGGGAAAGPEGGLVDGGARADAFAAEDAPSSTNSTLDSDSGPEVNEGDSGSDGPAPTSCVAAGPGLTNCGPAGSGTESCCTSLEVQGGTYDRTYTSEADGGAVDQADPATVNRFRLDKYDVTVGRFRQYVNYLIDGGSPPADGSGRHNHLNGGQGLTSGAAGGGRYEAGWDATDWNANIATGPAAAGTWNTNLACEAGYDTWTSEPSNQENLPINCVNWYEAYAFCIWDGGFLPSEAEWEYVAAGGSQEREYPWGSADPGSTNQYAIYDAYYTADSTDIAPVGTATLGAAAWGQLDMAGEVYEWNLDWYAAYADPCDNCANLSSTEQAEAAGTTASRVFRGGNVNSVEAYLVPSLRYFNDPTYRAYGLGLRCARTP